MTSKVLSFKSKNKSIDSILHLINNLKLLLTTDNEGSPYALHLGNVTLEVYAVDINYDKVYNEDKKLNFVLMGSMLSLFICFNSDKLRQSEINLLASIEVQIADLFHHRDSYIRKFSDYVICAIRTDFNKIVRISYCLEE